ncbi:MAG: serine protease [candidate division NC10 bacterium]|nr:serine protease [candidate division NC10 bacterium]
MDASCELVKRALPAVVNLHVQVAANHPSRLALGDERMGSGCLIDPRGYILTVNYVVLGARSIRVTLHDGRALRGTLAAQDFDTGLAVVKISGPKLQALPLQSSQHLTLGQPVFIVATTSESERRVAGGHVTYLGDFDAYWEYMLDRCIKTTVLNPGFGGGPLLDLKGRVVGVVSLNLSEVAKFSLAIPTEMFERHRDELLQHGRVISRRCRAWVGFFPNQTEEGVVISGLVPDGPAASSGIKEGDVILAVDFQSVGTRQDLYSSLWRKRAGERVAFTIKRRSKKEVVEVISGDRAEFYK